LGLIKLGCGFGLIKLGCGLGVIKLGYLSLGPK